MNKLKFINDWSVAGYDDPEYSNTMSMLKLYINNLNLMKNQDVWSKTIRESVFVSAYPLAIWLASSWWRLNWEPLPASGRPSLDWRLAHELGAANHGFVWPQIIFASDTEMMQVWAVPSNVSDYQSIKYLNRLESPAIITLTDFQRGVENFISDVLERLNAMECHSTDLFELWEIIKEERDDQESFKYRRIEAEMGYDPDECPQNLMDKALELDQKMGSSTLYELAPVYGNSARQNQLSDIEEISESKGINGKPEIPNISSYSVTQQDAPWRRAVSAACALRDEIGQKDLIDNSKLCDLLGLRISEVEDWSPPKRYDAAIAIPECSNRFKFIPRKKHPIAKRFELARFIGDFISEQTDGQWLASTDLSTSRQKFQRAFAAEFLCPIARLKEFLQDDYSESAIEDAAENFQVSQRTVESLLSNNGLIYPSFDDFSAALPYHL